MEQQNKYRELRRIGGGGMAEVFSAEMRCQPGYSKMVAVKRVLPKLARNRRFIHMFLDEARLGLLLNHQNIVHVFDVGRSAESYFIVMEYVDGVTLKDIWDQLSLEVSLALVVEICRGLDYAHCLTDWNGEPLDIIHHDVNPANVLLSISGEVKLMDFGLAEAAQHLQQTDRDLVRGKFGYLSPEVVLGLDVDRRSDVFAVGVILFELATRRRLFRGKDDVDSLRLARVAAVPPPREINPEIPPHLEQLIYRALARDPGQRIGSARQLGCELTEALYKMGHAVSGFAIADEVIARREGPVERRSVEIATMIEEELVGFESLENDEYQEFAGGRAPRLEP